MKDVKFLPLTVKQTVCPFCSFACEFGVVFDDFGIKGVEYIKEGSSGGRLCPRGSAAAFYLNHPRRLSMPIKNGKTLDWPRATKELNKAFEKPKNVAVTFDRNITVEEYQSIIDFSDKMGVENIASTYFEPEAFLTKFLDDQFSIDEIDNAQMIIVLGDLFNQTPMISRSLIKWKLSDRKNRLVVIDSINSHTAFFASDFLKVTVGTESLLLLALAKENLKGIDVSVATGIPESITKDISQSFKDARPGLIICVLPFGHAYDPLLFAEGISRLSEFSKKKVVPFFEFAGFNGNQHFGSIIDLIKKKKIKHLINFGELFPYYYPQLQRDLKTVNIVTTSPLKYNSNTALPAALNLEKKGTILTTFGKKNLTGDIRPASGAKTVNEILALIKDVGAKGKSLQTPEVKIDIKARARKLFEKAMIPKKKKTFKLVGEKIAYNFLEFFEKERIKLNPLDARELGIQSCDIVSVKSKCGNVERAVKLTKDIDRGIVAVPVETPEVRGLFDFEINSGIINFIPTEVELCRKG